MGSPLYKSMLGMSYYIHSSGLGALVDGVRPDSEGVARAAGHPLAVVCVGRRSRAYITRELHTYFNEPPIKIAR